MPLLGKQPEALACLERAVAAAPFEADIRLSLAKALVTIGESGRAIAEVETVLRQDPRNADAWSHLGLAAMSAGDEARAEAAWRRAIEIEPKNADSLHNLSVLCGRTGRIEEAARLAERAHLWAPLDLANGCNLRGVWPPSAILTALICNASRCSWVAPDNLPATELFARLTLTRGAVPAGLETLSHHVRRHPQDPDAILALAGALRLVGRMPQALNFVDQALVVAPHHPFAKRLRMDLLETLGRFGEAWPDSALAQADLPSHLVVPKGTTTIDALVFGRSSRNCRTNRSA